MIYNPNDERFKSLYLEKMQTDYKVQKQEFERQKCLPLHIQDLTEAVRHAAFCS